MSELRADTITASDGTSPVTLTKQSAAKVWTTFNGQDATITTSNSFNESSLTDTNTGRYVVNFTNNMSSGDYSVTGTLGQSDATYGAGWFSTGNAYSTLNYTVSNTSSSHRISQSHSSSAGNVDYTDVNSLVHGDLA